MIVGGDSMRKPYNKGAYILVSKLKYPRVGDVVVFRNPVITKENKSMKLMGRIIAEPGDLLDAHANKLYRNGHALNIPFALKENFKLYLPKEGVNLRLTPDNLVAYREAIKKEHPKYAQIHHGSLYLNNKKMNRYTFLSPYYWILADIETSGPDSRHLGIISKDDIIGVVIMP